MNELKGQALAEEALRIYHVKEGNYPTGITVEDLEREIRLQGVRIASDNHLTALRSALNNSQAKGTWRNADVGMWLPGDGVSKSATGLSGRPLAEALYDFVRVHYPGGEFHYESARLALARTGVDVKGTGSTTRNSLAAASDLFEAVPGRRGLLALEVGAAGHT